MSLLYSFAGGLEGQTHALAAAQEATLHDDRYTTHAVSRSDSHFLGFSGYPEYPVSTHRVGGCDIYIEGRLYGTEVAGLDAALARLPELIIGDARDGELTTWLLNVDGEFVIYVFDRDSGGIAIVNDVLGRLPLYSRRTDGTLVVSRDLRFIAKLTPNLRFDRMAIAQHLLIGYPLGNRTLLDGVERVHGATLIRIGTAGKGLRVTRLHQFNFEAKPRAASGLRDNAVELVELFTRACRARSPSGCPKVISMSGGFDSRAIAAGFHAAGIAFSSATFLDHIGNATHDVAPAEQVAALFGSPWKLWRLGPPSADDVLKLLRMKSGMNPLAMSFLLPFLAGVREEYGPDLWFSTGELATFTLPEPAPLIALAQPRDLMDFIIAQAQKLPLELVARLSMLDQAEILAELERVIANYPERSLGQKLVHFVLMERALRWQSEAEDRNRCYFWTTTPFSDPRFLSAAMSCPDAQKRHYDLYREFLLELSPAAAAIEHAGMGSAIVSEKFRRDAKVAALLAQHPGLTANPRSTRTPFRSYGSDSMVVRWMNEQTASCAVLSDYLARPVLEDVLRRCPEYSWDRIDLLFTITAAIERIAR